jgi:homoaconitate hydratase
MNLVERLVARRVGRGVRSGEFVSLRPDHVLTHDNTAAVLLKFRALGARRIYDARQPVFALDHDIQNQSQANLNKYKTIEAFASEQGVAFYPAGRGIGHQIMIEEGFAFPGTFCVGADSHSNMYGGIGCLGTPVVRTDAAGIWATGSTWWQVPLVVRIELHGTLRTGVTGKDVILALCGLLNRDEVLNKAVEFTGPGIESLSVDDRLSIANMTTEWGAQTGTFPIDSKVFEWVEQRIKALKDKGVSNHSRVNFDRLAALERDFPRADPYALYFKTYRVDLSSISPLVTGPDTVKKVQSVHELERQNIRVDKAYIVSCVNSRASDLESAAQVLRGKKIAPGVELYVAAASSEVQEQSETSGAWKAIVDAGAVVLPAGCGPCIGMGAGLLKDGEVGISATNRNFKGRMGSRNAQAYLGTLCSLGLSFLREQSFSCCCRCICSCWENLFSKFLGKRHGKFQLQGRHH